MRLVKSLRSSRQTSQATAGVDRRNIVELLEPRTLLNATATTSVPTQNVALGGSANLNLGSYFSDPTVTGTAIEIQTPLGNIPLTLYDSKTPKTIANFEHYINTGEYSNVLVHRSVPGFVIQGGGYTTSATHINQFSPVQGEPGVSNTTGTIAMALSSGPNSGTSEWFINLANNNGSSGGANLDNSSDGGPFTAFGNVIYNGMTVVSQIAGLHVVNDQTQNGAFTNLPVLSGYSGSSTPSSVPASDMVVTNTVVVPALTFSVQSDNPSLVSGAVSGSTLNLTGGSGSGTAHLTVTATDLGGHVATSTFAVNVGTAAAKSVTIGKGATATIVRFTDADGTASQVTITGAGTASLQFQGAVTPGAAKGGIISVSGTPSSVSLSTSGTDKSTNVTITGRGGNGVVDLAGITTDAPVHSITGHNTALTGNAQAAGGLANLTLRSATNGIIGVGSGATQLSLNIDSGGNESVNSGATINNLTAASWGAGAQIHAPTITRVNVKNFFAADVTTGAIGTFHAGSITGGTWTITGKTTTVSARTSNGWSATFGSLQTLAIAGAFDNSKINSTGNIGTVNALSTSGSNIFAGVASSVTTLPSSSGDFRSPMSIGVLHVARSFVNTNVAAGNLGRISAGAVQLSNNGTPFGFATSSILTLDARAGGKHLSLHKVTTQSQVDTALTKSGISAQNFAIRII